MIIFKKTRQNALFDIANSEIISNLVYTFLNQSKTEENSWLNSLTYDKKDKGDREIVVGADAVAIRPVFRGDSIQNGIIYGFEKSGYSKITAHRNLKGRIDVSQIDMIKLFAEEFAAQLVMVEFGLAYKYCGFSSSDSERFGTDVVLIRYNVKKFKNQQSFLGFNNGFTDILTKIYHKLFG